jgi:hypothetical protein
MCSDRKAPQVCDRMDVASTDSLIMPIYTAPCDALYRIPLYAMGATDSLLAGIDLLTGKVHALVKDRHRSREFIEFLELLDAAYPAPYGDQVDPRQSFRPHLQGDQSLARQSARRPLRIHLHTETRLVAQPR